MAWLPKQKKGNELYFNRDLSALAFINRVFSLSKDKNIPLLERLRFLFITASLLDEFFEIRIANLKAKLADEKDLTQPTASFISPLLIEISEKVHVLVNDMYNEFNEHLIPELAKHHVIFIQDINHNNAIAKWVKRYFEQNIHPILSPIGIDISHPFPRLINKNLNFAVLLKGKDAFGRNSGLAVLNAPRTLPRIIQLPSPFNNKGYVFIPLTTIIKTYAAQLFPGMKIINISQFRLTRNSDIYLEETRLTDLASALRTELYARRFGSVTRLEVEKDCPADIINFLLSKHQLSTYDVYHCNGPVNLSKYSVLFDMVHLPSLRYPSFKSTIPSSLAHTQDVFETLRKNDVLLHHPFESFTAIVDFIHKASLDPNVLAIKQTLYRTDFNSHIVQSLIEAARAGKEVTVIIELRARFDEASNLELANKLQEAGALVIYGVIGFKTHAKMTLIIRRENKSIQRYAHLSTGNYHEHTAELYTDFGLLTSHPLITMDIQHLFQLLTGMGKKIKFHALLPSPFKLHKKLLKLIHKEKKLAMLGRPASIIMKVNALTDSSIIQALYDASQKGVKIDLIVRGMCCLKPGIVGLSENIQVRSIVGRFLEHARIYYFHNDGKELLYCSSADMMERNLYHRVEVCFPILNPTLAQRVKQEGLMMYLKDHTDAWVLDKSGLYNKVLPKHGVEQSAQSMLTQLHSKNS